MLQLIASPERRFAAAALSVTSAAVLMLTGCGLGTPSSSSDQLHATFAGKVMGGQQPVTGSHIALYATNSNGYGGTITPLATATTDASGSFRITTAYTCPSTQQAYLVSTGGNPGLTGNIDNSAIFLVAALGSCTNVGSSTFIIINEATTVAAAYALSGFAPVGGANMTEAAVVANSASGFTTTSTNTVGLSDGFANAINVIAPGAGQVNAVSAAGNGVIPVATVNSLADILQDCVNSALPTSPACASLFTNATPPTGSGVAAPVNVFQAALDIAQYPGNNVTNLYNLISAQAAFGPTLTTAPNDWTIGIAYTSSQIATPLGMAIDDSDNVWVVGSTTADVAEFSPLGNPISPAPVGTAQGGWIPALNTTIDNVRNLSFDQTGNAWISDGATGTGAKTGLIEYTPSTATTTYQSYAAASADANNYINAVDASGNVWTSAYKASTCATSGSKICQYIEFPKSTAYAPISVFGSTSITALIPGAGITDAAGARGMAANAKTTSPGVGDIWAADNVGSSVQIFQSPYSSQPIVATYTTGGVIAAANGLSLDTNGNAWISGGTSNTLYQVSRTGASLATVTNAQLNKPFYMAIDGNGNIFVANSLAQTGTPTRTTATAVVTGANTVTEYSPSFNSNTGAFLSPNIGFAPSATYTPVNGTTPAFVSGGPINADSYVAVDRSGALWVLSGGTAAVTNGSTTLAAAQPSNLVQILGVAAPTRAVLAFGQYGVKP